MPPPMPPTSTMLTAEAYVDGVRGGDRAVLARAITLIESEHASHTSLGQEVLTRLLPHTGAAHRIGITGPPGVGKSTFIDALGMRLVEEAGLAVGVLTVDPSSSVSGGSILGDKSRMTRLAMHPRAFIRPSPDARTPGGVARRTREAMLLLEAAGYDVVLVETVGVGQSELLVVDMVDTFLALMLPGAGDELQGIKRGVLELADIVAVNKADGDLLPLAKRACADYGAALHYRMPRSGDAWRPRAVTCSARTGDGIAALWALLCEHREALQESGAWEAQRRQQRQRWLWSLIDERLRATFRDTPAVAARLADAERAVIAGSISSTQAAHELLALFARRR